jgi:beta-glucosidase
LPVTFPRSLADVPPFEDYAMRGRTYRFAEAEALYPFGFGLSYTRFEYSELELSTAEEPASPALVCEAEVTLRNAGQVASDEVVQLYVRDLEASVPVPRHELRGMARVHLLPGEATRVRFRLDAAALSLIDERGQRLLEPGVFRIFVGGGQPDPRSQQLLGSAPLFADLRVSGAPVPLPY